MPVMNVQIMTQSFDMALESSTSWDDIPNVDSC